MDLPTKSRIFKVTVMFQEKDEVFYTRVNFYRDTIIASLHQIITQRYPSLEKIISRCYVIGEFPDRIQKFKVKGKNEIRDKWPIKLLEPSSHRFIEDKCGSQFSIINVDDLRVFIDGEDLFENEIHVEIEGVTRNNKESSPTPSQQSTPPPRTNCIKRVKVDECAEEATQSEDKPVHANVVCDCCDSVIVGFRYKCTECYNFDLCSGCEGKMRHREHMMLRIPEPVDRMHVFKDRHCRTPKWFATEVTTNETSKSSKRHHKKHHHKGHHPHHNGMNEFFKALGVECPMMNVPETATEATASGTEQPDGGQQIPEARVYPDFQKLLKVVENVAENVSKYFDPHLISVVPDLNEPEKTPEATPKAATTPVKEKKTISEQDQVNSAFADLTVNSPAPSAPIVPTTEQVITIMDVDESANKPLSKAGSLDGDAEWTVLENEGPMEDAESNPQTSGGASSSSKPDSTPVLTPVSVPQKDVGYEELARNLQKDIEEQLKSTSMTSSTQTAPSVREVPIVYHPVPHIDKGVRQMMDMGFSNEGNFLTNLMVSCGGDINKCLNILSRR